MMPKPNTINNFVRIVISFCRTLGKIDLATKQDLAEINETGPRKVYAKFVTSLRMRNINGNKT